MNRHRVSTETGFSVLSGTRRSQSARMVLEPGSSTGGPDNRHQDSDQWLFVVDGTGSAVVGGEEVDLQQGTALLIEAGETHEIRNDGGGPLVTFNVYAPPAY